MLKIRTALVPKGKLVLYVPKESSKEHFFLSVPKAANKEKFNLNVPKLYVFGGPPKISRGSRMFERLTEPMIISPAPQIPIKDTNTVP